MTLEKNCHCQCEKSDPVESVQYAAEGFMQALGVAPPTTLYFMKTSTFLSMYTFSNFAITLSCIVSSAVDLTSALIYAVAACFPLIGFLGVRKSSRKLLAIYTGYVFMGLIVVGMTAVLGMSFIHSSDFCSVLSEYFDWDSEMISTCVANTPVLKMSFAASCMMAVGFQSFLLLQLEKYCGYLRRTQWTRATTVPCDVKAGFPGIF